MSSLQFIWFLLIGVLLAGYAILDGFDLGVGFWHLFARKNKEKRTFLNAIGPIWDGNEVWLLTGGGAIFAAFPPVYASVFSGFYMALMLVLLGLIFRAVAMEFRHQVDSDRWRASWDIAFSVGSLLPALLFGVALGNIVRGLELHQSGNYVGGFFALLNPFSLLVGVTGLVMFITHGALYLALKTDGELRDRVRGWAGKAWILYLVLFLASGGWSLASFQRGYAAVTAVAGLCGLVFIAGIRLFLGRGRDGLAFLMSALSIASIWIAVGSSIYPNMVPASNDGSLSLTIYNASSSQTTLTTMLVVALVGMPLVIGYTIYVYRVFKGKVALGEGSY